MRKLEPGKMPDRPPSTPNEWGIVIILSFFFGVLICLELFSDYTPAKLSLPFFLASWVILLVIHEAGHALMAILLGWRVSLISIGTGKIRLRVTLLDIPVEIRTIPLSGFVRPQPTDLVAPRLKQFCIFAAGPGIELLLAALLITAVGADNLLERSNNISLIAIQSFIVATVFGSVINLIPFPIRTETGTSWSDGLGMILCWRLPESWFRDQISPINHRQA
tara:strand:+ start:469 stop:1131 length:663 start_codon:yes stop_codon:yes gene_type:complete